MLLSAAYKGDSNNVVKAKAFISDYGWVKGYPGFVTLFDEQIYTLKEWNPLLLAIISNNTNIVKILVEDFPETHLKSIISEPITSDVDGHLKR